MRRPREQARRGEDEEKLRVAVFGEGAENTPRDLGENVEYGAYKENPAAEEHDPVVYRYAVPSREVGDHGEQAEHRDVGDDSCPHDHGDRLRISHAELVYDAERQKRVRGEEARREKRGGHGVAEDAEDHNRSQELRNYKRERAEESAFGGVLLE